MDSLVIRRETSLPKLLDVMAPYLGEVRFDPEEWFFNENNLALTNSRGDYGLFTYEKPGVVSGHYFFTSRGKDAIEVSKDILSYLFNNYEVHTVMGLTPVRKKGALFLNKKLHFKSYGSVETVTGPAELVILTSKEWNAWEA